MVEDDPALTTSSTPTSVGGGQFMNGARFGQPAPDFALPATSQPEITLSSFKGKSDVVLVFYCYDWGTI